MRSMMETADIPSWLRWFGNDASRAIISLDDDPAPVGCHIFLDAVEIIWEVTIFAGFTEIVGGPSDGQRLADRTHVDISAAVELFDNLPEIRWQTEAICDDDELGAHVSLEGSVRGRHVWLRILRSAPSEAGPSRLLYDDTGNIESLW